MANWRQRVNAMMETCEPTLLAYAHLVSADSSLASTLVERAVVSAFPARRGRPVTERSIRMGIALAYLSNVRSVERRRAFRHMLMAEKALDAIPVANITVEDPVLRAVGRLSPRARTCVVLAYLDALSVAEIAHLLSISTAHVRLLLHDAISQLESTLGAFEDANVDAITVETRS